MTPFLTAHWQALAMLNYEIDPDVLAPFVPQGTELDAFDGRTVVSIVAFRFLDTRVRGIAVPFHRDFDEMNLRFYVRRKGPDGWRRGVVFFKEVVPRRAIAWIARAFYNENYVACATSSDVRLPVNGGAGRVAYAWMPESGEISVTATIAGTPRIPPADAEATFITEHYWGYARQRDGGTVEYRVEHPQWRVWDATQASLAGNAGEFYGGEFGAALARVPTSAFVAEGSAVKVYPGERIA